MDIAARNQNFFMELLCLCFGSCLFLQIYIGIALAARGRHPTEGTRVMVLLEPMPEFGPVGERKQGCGVQAFHDSEKDGF